MSILDGVKLVQGDRMTLGEAKTVQRQLGARGWQEVGERLQAGDAEAMQLFAWVSLRRRTPDAPASALDEVTLGELTEWFTREVPPDDDGAAEAAGGPTGGGGV